MAPPHCRIHELGTVKATGHTYVQATAWHSKADYLADRPAWLTEEFLMALRPTGARIVTNAEGWLKTADGKFVDPATLGPGTPEPEWALETFTRDVPAEIRANVTAYFVRARVLKLAGDHTSDATKPLYKDGVLVPQKASSPLIERDTSDPHKILERPDVQVLKDAGFEVAEITQLWSP